MSVFERADALVRTAQRKRFTAAQLRVEHRGSVVFERAYGTLDDTADALPATVATRFDIASLTKPFVAAAVLREIAAGRLTLDASLCDLLPEWRGAAHAPITVRMLLAHVSGMQSGAHYSTLLNESVEHFSLTRPLVAAPREKVIYSDLGFIALGVILERLRGRSLSALLEETARALGAASVGYRPRAEDIAKIPATEHDAWRGRVRGTVHDEKAHLMNGVAGHAGLFATAADVAVLAEAFLGPACGRPNPFLPAELVREALAEQAEDEMLYRGLGWMLRKREENSCGELMRRGAFGHTGFTGTCVWVDPSRDLQIVLLTNAVYHGRSDLRAVRASICDAVTAAIDA